DGRDGTAAGTYARRSPAHGQVLDRAGLVVPAHLGQRHHPNGAHDYGLLIEAEGSRGWRTVAGRGSTCTVTPAAASWPACRPGMPWWQRWARRRSPTRCGPP